MDSQDQTSPSNVNANASDHTIETLHRESELPGFEYFPKLPFEISQKIWKDICHIRRNIGLWARYVGGYCNIFLEDIYQPVRFGTNAGVPAILHTSSEARKEALKHYTLEFGDESSGRIDGAEVSLYLQPKIYVNLHVDCICLVRDQSESRSESGVGMEDERVKSQVVAIYDRLSEICRGQKLQEGKLDAIALSESLYKASLANRNGDYDFQ